MMGWWIIGGFVVAVGVEVACVYWILAKESRKIEEEMAREARRGDFHAGYGASRRSREP